MFKAHPLLGGEIEHASCPRIRIHFGFLQYFLIQHGGLAGLHDVGKTNYNSTGKFSMRLLLSVVFPLVVAGLRGLDSFDLKPNDDTLLAQFGFEVRHCRGRAPLVESRVRKQANGKMAANFSVEIPKNYDGHVVTLGCYMDDWSKVCLFSPSFLLRKNGCRPVALPRLTSPWKTFATFRRLSPNL